MIKCRRDLVESVLSIGAINGKESSQTSSPWPRELEMDSLSEQLSPGNKLLIKLSTYFSILSVEDIFNVELALKSSIPLEDKNLMRTLKSLETIF